MWDRIRRWFGTEPPKKSTAYPPIPVGEYFLTADAPPLRSGPLVGRLAAIQMRTVAGCSIGPDETLTRLIVLVPATGPALPLKPATFEAEELERHAKHLHTWKEVLFDSGVQNSPGIWFGDTHLASAGLSLGDTVEMNGFAYPMFVTGTVGPYPVWGWYIQDGSLTMAGAPPRQHAPLP